MKAVHRQRLAGTVMPLALLAGAGINAATVERANAAPVKALPSAQAMPTSFLRVASNPCAAKTPCGARKSAARGCLIPRLAKANPCAAKNPCAAANPCGPCGAAKPAELTQTEANAAYACLRGQLKAAYAKSGHPAAKAYMSWKNYATTAYSSSTHGGRFVNNYANPKAKAYGKFEQSGKMPVGAILAKDSFEVSSSGQVSVGPLFLMEKMGAGFNKASGNWRYTMIMPNGSVFGITKAKNNAGMTFCTECHAAVGEMQDHMFFLPTEHRAR